MDNLTAILCILPFTALIVFAVYKNPNFRMLCKAVIYAGVVLILFALFLGGIQHLNGGV